MSDQRPSPTAPHVTGWTIWEDTSVPEWPWCLEAMHAGLRRFMRVRTEEDALHGAARNLEDMKTLADYV